MRDARTLVLALLLAGLVGCRSAPLRRPAGVAPQLPPPPSAAGGGERQVLLDQLHQIASEDAAATTARR